MEKKNLVPTLAALLALAAVASLVYLFAMRGDSAAPRAETTYQSRMHGYTLRHPAALAAREYENGDVTFGEVFEAQVLTIEGTPGQPFEDAVTDRLKQLCAADGPSESFSCTGVTSLAPFSTDAGVSGFRVYLTGTLTNVSTRELVETRMGPYYAIPLRTSATMSTVLVVRPPLNQPAAEADVSTIEAAASSVVLTAPVQANPTIEEYVAQNIAVLSPQKEVLGGIFYVTQIEAHGGTGTVEYEDGHTAHVADFTYVISETGVPSVTSFTIR